VDFQLQSVASVEAMSRVMGDMGKLMKKQSEKVNIRDIEQAMREFNKEMEKGELMNERIEEMMDMDD
jgi:division protein CdvB (Snf7/Vps24/ESCRT-III family)